MGTYRLLDLTPNGRDEQPGRNMEWVRHHDRYESAPLEKATSAASAGCAAHT